MGKRYDWQVTPQNTPRFKEKRVLVLLANGLFILNLLIIAICHPDDRKDSLICAAFAFVYALISIFEKRKAEWEWGGIIIVCSLCFLGSAAWIYKTGFYWYYIGYGIEMLIFILAAVLMFKKKAPKFHGCRKLYLFLVWECDRLDSYLSRMEKDGHRLVGTSWFGLMYFQKSAPKTVRYFCTYTCLKDRSMNGIEDELRSKYRANPIPTGIGTRQIHRITDIDVNLTELEELRRKSLLSIILERLFFAVLLPVTLICIAVSFHIDALLWIAVTILSVVAVYYSTGIASIYRKQ